jgi:hypothetical protein
MAAKELAFVEKCVIKTMRAFRENPQRFWSDEDVCCHLKGLLLKGRLLKRGRSGNIFLGFNTRNRYRRGEEGLLVASNDDQSERFALVGWSSTIPTSKDHLTQQLSFAVELKHFRSVPTEWIVQVRNSLLKLSDEANQIPANGRFFLLLAAQSSSQFGERLNSLLAEFPSVRCYQQLAQ